MALAEIVKSVSMIYELVNVKRPLSEEGILIVSEGILEEYWYMKIEEIGYAFRKGIRGKYGKVLDRLDALVIFDWLNQYNASDEVIHVSEKQSADFKQKDGSNRNESLLDVPEFVDKIKGAVLANVIPVETYKNERDDYFKSRTKSKLSEEEKKEHRELIEKQREQILKTEL